MKPLPETAETPVLRTDFSDDATWAALKVVIVQANEMGFRAYVDIIDDSDYRGVTLEEIIKSEQVPDNEADEDYFSFLFVVNDLTFSHPETPILCVDLADDIGRTFRVIPSQMWTVENNLNCGNLLFEEFANEVDGDGILRR